MNKQIFLLFFLCCNLIFSQYEIKIKASVLDKKTSKPVSLANVNFKHTKIGAFTTNAGVFNLNYDEKLINDDDIFVINAKGFKTIEIKAKPAPMNPTVERVSPRRKPTANGMIAPITAEIGATTLIGPSAKPYMIKM